MLIMMQGDLKIQVVFCGLNDLKNSIVDLLHVIQMASSSEIEIKGAGYDTLLILEQLTEGMYEHAEAEITKLRKNKKSA